MTLKMRSEKFLKSLDYELVIWDYKQQIPIMEMQPHILNGFVHLQEVDTGGDWYATILTKIELTPDEAQYLYGLYEHQFDDEEEEND